MYQSNQSLNIPPGIPRAFERRHAPLIRLNRIGRENNRINNRNNGPSPENNKIRGSEELGDYWHLITTHRRVGNLIACLDYMLQVALIPHRLINPGGDGWRQALMNSKIKIAYSRQIG